MGNVRIAGGFDVTTGTLPDSYRCLRWNSNILMNEDNTSYNGSVKWNSMFCSSFVCEMLDNPV